MQHINDWCKFNKLSLNIKKTKYMVFNHNKNKLYPDLKLNYSVIERVQEYKYLGFNVDDKLKHNNQMQFIISKLASFSFMSYKLKYQFTLESALSFYYGLINSKISYCILVWGGHLFHSSEFKRAEKYFKKIILNLFSNHIKSLNYTHILKKLEILDIKNVFKYRCCLTIYKILNCNYMPFLKEELVKLSKDHCYRTRFYQNFNNVFKFKNLVKHNFLYEAVKIWNSVPIKIRTAQRLSSFKRELKLYLIKLL